MKNLKLKSIIFLLIFISCSSSSENMSYLICNDSIEYWDYNMIRNEQNIWFTFSFDKNGEVLKYSYRKDKQLRWLFNDYRFQTKFTWSISNDSVLSFMGSKSKIVEITKDYILAKDLITDEKNEYFRVKGNLNVQDD